MLQYTVDWTTPHEPIWLEWLGHLRDKPGIRMAEIGCFEGRSSRWFVENILTGEGSKLCVVDNFAGGSYVAFCRNVEALAITWIANDSKHLHDGREPFDAIYLDADHKPSSVLIDACNAWQALKPGGILIFDDYHLVDTSRAVDVKPAVDAFCGIMGLTKHHSPWPNPKWLDDDHGQVMVRKSL